MDADTQESEEKPQRITGRKPETEIKHAAMMILEQNGMSHGAIAKALDYHTKSVSRALPAIRKESLQHPRRLKLAAKTVDAVMTGYQTKKEIVVRDQVVDGVVKPVNVEIDVPVDDRVKASDALRAAELVYSRAEPVKQEQGGSVVQTFYQVNQQFFGQVASSMDTQGIEQSKQVIDITPKTNK